MSEIIRRSKVGERIPRGYAAHLRASDGLLTLCPVDADSVGVASRDIEVGEEIEHGEPVGPYHPAMRLIG